MNQPAPDPMRDEAAAWVASMDSGQWTELDEIKLRAWLEGHPRRATALFQMQASWFAVDQALSSAGRHAEAPHRSRRGSLSRRTLWLGAGTAIAASVAGGIGWIQPTRSYLTTRGEIRRVPLDDGSVATINTMSKVDVSFRGSRRDLLIERGEAWFQVAKDPSRPFRVSSGRTRAQAVGTAFSVRKHDGGSDVIVTEGTVDVWTSGMEGSTVRLTAGNAVFVADDATVRRLALSDVGVDGPLAWRTGKITLTGETLSQAIVEFNRYNARQLVVVDPGIGAQILDGTFQVGDPEGFARAVQRSLNVEVDLSNPSQIQIGSVRPI